MIDPGSLFSWAFGIFAAASVVARLKKKFRKAKGF